MKYIIDQDLHIHSFLSTCSRNPKQTAELLMEYAKENNLKRICVTDHYWDSEIECKSAWYRPQNFEHISRIKPLPCDDEVEFLFGCETEMDRFFTLGMPKERFDDFDFVIIPTTHMHMSGFTISTEDEDMHMLARIFSRSIRSCLIPLLWVACDCKAGW